jgi:hypothetical protein
VGRSLIEIALRCYPKWWIDRYGEEMRAVIDDLEHEGRSSGSIAAGLFRDALRSRLLARGMPRTYGLVAHRTRTSIAASTLPWLAIIPFLTLVTSRMTLHSSSGGVQIGFPFDLSTFRTRVVPEPGVHWVHPSISAATWVMATSSMFMSALFIVTLLTLAVALGALRYGIVREKRHNRRSLYLLTWVAPLTLLVLVALDFVQLALTHGSSPRQATPTSPTVWVGPHSALAALTGNLMWTVATIGWLVAMAGIIRVANRANLPPETLRFGRTVSVLTSVSLSLTFIAFTVWGVAINVQNHQSHIAGAIVATYPRFAYWLPMTFVLGLASVVSIASATSARRSWRTIYVQRLWDT